MSRFQFEINVEPKDIPNLDDAHKRDCADALNKVVNHVFRYTLILSAAVMAFFGAYSLFSFTYLLRMEKMLPSLPIILPLAALVVFVLEFISGTMNKAALIVEVILNIIMLFASIVKLSSVWIAPFALYGAVIHLKLFTLMPFYKVISEQKGYPEFTSLPTRDEIVIKKDDSSESAVSDVSPENNSENTFVKPDKNDTKE